MTASGSGSQWSCLRSSLEENGVRERWFTSVGLWWLTGRSSDCCSVHCAVPSLAIVRTTSIWQSSASACPVLYRYWKLTCLIFYISRHNKCFQPRYAAAAAAAAVCWWCRVDDVDGWCLLYIYMQCLQLWFDCWSTAVCLPFNCTLTCYNHLMTYVTAIRRYRNSMLLILLLMFSFSRICHQMVVWPMVRQLFIGLPVCGLVQWGLNR